MKNVSKNVRQDHCSNLSDIWKFWDEDWVHEFYPVDRRYPDKRTRFHKTVVRHFESQRHGHSNRAVEAIRNGIRQALGERGSTD